jgi:hypothetical protein
MDETLACVEYYCRQLNELSHSTQSICNSLSIPTFTLSSSSIIDDLVRNMSICLDILDQYQHDRLDAVQSLLSSPFREDAWHLVHEMDSNLFGKSRIILIRLRTSFLLLYRILNEIVHISSKNSYHISSVNPVANRSRKRRRHSAISLSHAE